MLLSFDNLPMTRGVSLMVSPRALVAWHPCGDVRAGGPPANARRSYSRTSSDAWIGTVSGVAISVLRHALACPRRASSLLSLRGPIPPPGGAVRRNDLEATCAGRAAREAARIQDCFPPQAGARYDTCECLFAVQVGGVRLGTRLPLAIVLSRILVHAPRAGCMRRACYALFGLGERLRGRGGGRRRQHLVHQLSQLLLLFSLASEVVGEERRAAHA